MCATVLWVLNASAYTGGFERFTAERIGVAPGRSSLVVRSSLIRPSAVAFTLTRRMCDCGCLIGLRGLKVTGAQVQPAAWLGWLRDLPAQVPHVTRLAVLRAWNGSVLLDRARSVTISAVDEALLRSIENQFLLTIDYELELSTSFSAHGS